MERDGGSNGSADAPGGREYAPRANPDGGVVLVIGSGVMGARIAAWFLILGLRVRVWTAANKYEGDTETSVAEAIAAAHRDLRRAMQDDDELYMSAATAAAMMVSSENNRALLAALPFAFSQAGRLMQASPELWTRLEIQAVNERPGWWSNEKDTRSAEGVWLALDCTRDPNTPEERVASAKKISRLLGWVHRHAPDAVLAIKHENIDPADINVPNTPVLRLRFIKPVFFIPIVNLEGDSRQHLESASDRARAVVAEWLKSLHLVPVFSSDSDTQRSRLMNKNVLTEQTKRLMLENAQERYMEGPWSGVEPCVICLDRPAQERLAPCGHRCICFQCYWIWSHGDNTRHSIANGCPMCRRSVERHIQNPRHPVVSPEVTPQAAQRPSPEEVAASHPSYHLPALNARLVADERLNLLLHNLSPNDTALGIQLLLERCPRCNPGFQNEIERIRAGRPGFKPRVCFSCVVQPPSSWLRIIFGPASWLQTFFAPASWLRTIFAPASWLRTIFAPASSIVAPATSSTVATTNTSTIEEATGAQTDKCSTELLIRAARLFSADKNTKKPNTFQTDAAILSMGLPKEAQTILKFEISAMNERRKPREGIPITQISGLTVVDHQETSGCRQGMCQFLSVAAGLVRLAQRGQAPPDLALSQPALWQLAAAVVNTEALRDLADRLLELAVAHMREHAEDFQEFCVASVQTEGGACTYSEYCARLLREGWGDLLTLRALHNILGVAIQVHSTQEDFNVPVVINTSDSQVAIDLGHVHGMHYVELVVEVPAPAAILAPADPIEADAGDSAAASSSPWVDDLESDDELGNDLDDGTRLWRDVG